MQGAALVVGKTKSNRFKAYIWEQPDGHVSDWQGCNYRIATVEGQPHKGYETQEQAIEFAKSQFKTKREVVKYGSCVGNGSFLTDQRFRESQVTDVRLPVNQE